MAIIGETTKQELIMLVDGKAKFLLLSWFGNTVLPLGCPAIVLNYKRGITHTTSYCIVLECFLVVGVLLVIHKTGTCVMTWEQQHHVDWESGCFCAKQSLLGHHND
jgi:hypothetical protein